MSVIPEEYLDLMQSRALAHMATIGPKGEPHTTPVWFGWDGTHMLFSLTKGRQKYRNLQREPRLALSIVDPTDPYRFIEVRGRLVRIDEDPDRRFINWLAKKYINQDVHPYHQPGDEWVVMVVEPKHITLMPKYQKGKK